jgi:hypothetical protein
MVAFSAIGPYDRRLMATYRAGASIEDYCRACKTDRIHTIVVLDPDGKPLRVSCGFCHSEHNFRGGPRVGTATTIPGAPAMSRRPKSSEPFPLISDRERTAPAMTLNSPDIELLLRRIIREEAGVTPVVPAEKWRGGTLVLRPAAEGQQAKNWPIETFFHKIVMLRNRLRTLEQQVNASDLPDDVKVKLQAHVTGCYGSLTSFNVLFADDEDQFKGSGGDQDT